MCSSYNSRATPYLCYNFLPLNLLGLNRAKISGVLLWKKETVMNKREREVATCIQFFLVQMLHDPTIP